MKGSRGARAVLMLLACALSTGAVRTARVRPSALGQRPIVPLTATAKPVPPSASAGPARVVRDINTYPDPLVSGSQPYGFTRLGGVTLFAASTPETGREIWKTDGTPAGTSLVKDVAPGPGGYVEQIGPELNGAVFFIDEEVVHGLELWKSDGTAEGTVLVKDIGPEFTAAVFPQPFVVLDGALYFVANDGVHGGELWKSDGTEAGTVLVKDILPGPQGGVSQNMSWMASYSGSLFFAADDGIHGRELWKSDGTEEGTVLAMDLVGGPQGSNPSYLTLSRGLLYFAATDDVIGTELWATDGTEAGTRLVKDIVQGPEGSGPGPLTDVGDTLYFAATDPAHGYELWRTDGTADGTVLVKDITPGPLGSLFSQFTSMNGMLFFVADDGSHGWEVWRSDGTEAGTHLLKDINPGRDAALGPSPLINPPPLSLLVMNERLVFGADDGVHGTELWTSDGTEAGTSLLKEILPGPVGSGPFGFAIANGSLFFSADDGQHGPEPWISDGTAAGTVMIKDINPHTKTAGSDPGGLGEAGGKLYFIASEPDLGRGLWVTDGTSDGTNVLESMPTGIGSGSIAPLGEAGGGLIYCKDVDPFHSELWKTGGTAAATTFLGPFPGPCVFVSTIVAGDVLFLGAGTYDQGGQVWKTDGTESGTVLVRGTDREFLGAPRMLGASGGVAYFSVDDGIHGEELWRTDGTGSGTFLLKDINSGPYGSFPGSSVRAGTSLFFAADDGIHGGELWKTDGTEAGTVLVKDVDPGPDGGVSFLVAAPLDGTLIFTGVDPIHGGAVWKSDGTESGTVLVKDFPLATHPFPNQYVAAGSAVFFSANDGVHGTELWETDGTEERTVLVKDIRPGPAASLIESESIGVEGSLVFIADDLHGTGLWRSDGTEKGTVLVQVIVPPRPAMGGIKPRGPQWNLTLAGTRLFFTADDQAMGRELWAGRASILAGQPARALEHLKAQVQSLHLPRGTETSLMAMLDSASHSLSAGRKDSAIVALENFSRHVEVQTPRAIDESSASDLQQFAGDLITLLQQASP